MIARRALSEIDPMIATGIPIRSGQGVAMTSTARKRTASPLPTHAPTASTSAIGVYTAPSWSPSRRSRGRLCSDSRITSMMRAYRESDARSVASITRADDPLTAPEITVDPAVLDIWNGSPVRYDSSIEPWPSTTRPSTGQTSCGNTTSTSPTATSPTATSVNAPAVRR